MGFFDRFRDDPVEHEPVEVEAVLPPANRVSIMEDAGGRFRVLVRDPDGKAIFISAGFGFKRRMEARQLASVLMANPMEMEK